MSFNSWQFALFFITVVGVYYVPCFRKLQVFVLAIASLLFYAFGSSQLIALLLLSIGINALMSYWIYREEQSQRKKLLLALGVIFNLFILCAFKYKGLILIPIQHRLPDALKLPPDFFAAILALPLPLGISFFCFEGISLCVDSYKRLFERRATVESTARDTTLFVAFFPHLISGPILRAGDFFPQIKPKAFAEIDWYYCFKWMVLGYFLKLFVADNLFDICLKASWPNLTLNSTITNVALLLGFSFTIFADFAGYSFIALGLAGILGYRIPQNFTVPYTSRSLGEFWTRWHISLSSWLRDYLFIPLGGSKCSRPRACLNVLIVMFLGGLWHGASWNFAFWGLVHGIGLSVEQAFKGRFKISANFGLELLQIATTFAFVTLAWIPFVFRDTKEAWRFIHHTMINTALPIGKDPMYVLLFSLPVILWHLYFLLKEKGLLRPVSLWNSDGIRSVVLGIMIFLTLVNAGPTHAFIYFKF